AASIKGDGTITFNIDSAMTKTATATEVGDASNTVVSGFEFDVATGAADKDTSVITVDNSASKFQIGANSSQNTSLGINDMSSIALGVNKVDITTQSGANDAILTISNAISSVSSERAKLGGMQNRLEHTINNLSVTSENLASSESRIRDVDMAKEMMEFTKNNILSQAATAMLAQANQQPQSVLQLLQ
ncbi:MAG: flagellin, partial [Peptostreptococcaceae bacterium]|nr:flagellin [Peptostreptococcaceae bacterium]